MGKDIKQFSVIDELGISTYRAKHLINEMKSIIKSKTNMILDGVTTDQKAVFLDLTDIVLTSKESFFVGISYNKAVIQVHQELMRKSLLTKGFSEN